MKKKVLFFMLIFALLLTACSTPAAESPAAAPDSGAQSADTATEAAPVAAPEATAEPTPIPAATLPPLQAESGNYIYTNANIIYDTARYENVIYAGGTGGLVAWEIGSGNYRKFDTMDGLRHISIYAVEVCNLPNPSVVIGHELGVDVLDLASGEFSPLSVQEEEPSINTKISELYCDQANNRLILGYSGIGVYDFVNNTYTRYTSSNGLSWNGVSGISVIGRDIWVMTGYNGVNIVAPDGSVTIYDESKGMQSQRAYSAARTSDGTVWVGASSGLLKFRGGQWTMIEGLPGEINNLVAAEDGTLWLSTYPIGVGRICQFDPQTETCLFTHEYTRDGIASFELLGESGQAPQWIFYGTRQGLQVLKYGEEKAEAWLIAEDNKLNSNFVASLALDANNMLWVGTGNGTHMIDPANPTGEWTLYLNQRDTPNVPGGNWASNLVPDSNGGMWAVFTNGQLSYFDGAGRWTVFDGNEYYSVRSLALDPQGRAWVAKDDQPVRVLENGELVVEYSVADGLPEGRINTLFGDGQTLWIGGNGLYRFIDGKIEMAFSQDEMGGVVALVREPDGSLLVARTNSLVRIGADNVPVTVLAGAYDSETLDVFTSLTSLAVDSQGSIYLGTSNGLLISEDGGATWAKITTEGGITTNYLRVAFIDQYNTLWMGGGDSFTGGGLLRYVP